MPKQKQSDIAFLMMKQWREQLDFLTYEQKGRLLEGIYKFQCDGTDFETDDAVVKMLWLNIRQVFEINNKKYEQICERNRRNGMKHKKHNPVEPTGFSGIPKEPI